MERVGKGEKERDRVRERSLLTINKRESASRHAIVGVSGGQGPAEMPGAG